MDIAIIVADIIFRGGTIAGAVILAYVVVASVALSYRSHQDRDRRITTADSRGGSRADGMPVGFWDSDYTSRVIPADLHFGGEAQRAA